MVSLRKDLANLINIPEHFPVLPNSWVTPVFDFATVDRPWPLTYVYVGHGPHGCGSNPSPWGHLFPILTPWSAGTSNCLYLMLKIVPMYFVGFDR